MMERKPIFRQVHPVHFDHRMAISMAVSMHAS